jgi:hypothetical protein
MTNHVDRPLVKVLVAKDIVFVCKLAALVPLAGLVVFGIANVLVPCRFLLIVLLDPSAQPPTRIFDLDKPATRRYEIPRRVSTHLVVIYIPHVVHQPPHDPAPPLLLVLALHELLHLSPIESAPDVLLEAREPLVHLPPLLPLETTGLFVLCSLFCGFALGPGGALGLAGIVGASDYTGDGPWVRVDVGGATGGGVSLDQEGWVAMAMAMMIW